MALLGIFVGGQSRRMGGSPKGLLLAPGRAETLIERLARIGRDSGLEPVLVGAASLGDVHASLECVPDREPRVGPLSGLAALLERAGSEPCIAIACDMPHVGAALLRRFLVESPDAAIIAARDPSTGKWEPLCARYQPLAVGPVLARALAAGARSFQDLFRELAVVEITLSDLERAELRDWDTPEDVVR